MLSSVVLAALGDARASARDSRRITDLRQIRTALDLYLADFGRYPIPHSGCTSLNCYTYSNSATWSQLESALEDYIKLPSDPLNTAGSPWGAVGYTYAYGNTHVPGEAGAEGHQYDLTAKLETENHPLSCKKTRYYWYVNGRSVWCTEHGGAYSNQIYEDSPYTNP